jgi:hypothetical protein
MRGLAVFSHNNIYLRWWLRACAWRRRWLVYIPKSALGFGQEYHSWI